MMAVSALMAASNNPNDSAIANGVASPLVTAPSTSARAMPIDTAVTATAVDNERGRQHQFDESDRSVLRRRNLTGIRNRGAGE